MKNKGVFDGVASGASQEAISLALERRVWSTQEIWAWDMTTIAYRENDHASVGDLDMILRQTASHGSEFAKTYANHAPMAVTALHYIGGSTERMQDFFIHYRDVHRLLPFGEKVSAVDRGNWRACLGDRVREPDLRDFFAAEVASLGIREALALYLPVLAPGVGASAFHALMRLAYALLRQDGGEVAAALAYWAATYLALPPSTGCEPLAQDPAEILARMAVLPALRTLPMHELLWHNMREMGAHPDFAPVVDWLVTTPDTLRRLAATSLALFAGTQEFCALHAVTGVHWLRIVLPYCPVPDLLIRHFWQGIAALMGHMGWPDMPTVETVASWRAVPAPGWDVITAAAARSYDEHDISLVFSAIEEEKCYGDPLYRIAAARRMQLIDAYV